MYINKGFGCHGNSAALLFDVFVGDAPASPAKHADNLASEKVLNESSCLSRHDMLHASKTEDTETSCDTQGQGRPLNRGVVRAETKGQHRDETGY